MKEIKLLQLEPVPCGVFSNGEFGLPPGWSIDDITLLGKVFKCPAGGGVIEVKMGANEEGAPRLIFSCNRGNCSTKGYANPPYPDSEF